jgi:serine/threonine protein kinase
MTSPASPIPETQRPQPSSLRVTHLDLHPTEDGKTIAAPSSQGPRRSLAALVVVPLLVASVGLLVLLSSHVSMRDSVTLMTNARFAELAHSVAHRVLAPFDQAADVLARIDDARRLSPEVTPDQLGLRLVAILRDHPSLAWITFSTLEGHHIGAFFEDNGDLLLNHVTPHSDDATLQQYVVSPEGALTLRERRLTPFDPRHRPFFRLALETPGALRWTKPYLFYDRGVYGVSATRTLHDAFPGQPPGPPVAVATVDFDLQSMSRLLSRLDAVPEGASVIFDAQGNVLAYSRSQHHAEIDQRDRGDIATAQTFHDPTLVAFLQAHARRPSSTLGDTQTMTFDADGEPYLASVTPFDVSPDQRWFIGVFAPESVLMAPVHRSNGYSLLISVVGLALGIAVSFWVANRLTRAQRAEAAARADALAARQQAQDLGSYTLVERLGEGAMGEVWRAQHAMLARPAAIKIIKPNPDQSPEAAAHTRDRFLQEARATAQLRCRHTIAIYDFGVSDDQTLFYVMELLDGIDLESLISTSGPLPAGRVVHLLCQACTSLAEAHAAGLIHRDIKPANIYVARIADEVDVVKVLDFGLVIHTRADQATSSGAHRPDFAGTPAYMAPEQIAGEPLDGRADLYALGCVAYWLMTGRLVFSALTIADSLRAHLHDAPAPPSHHNPSVNPHLEAVVLRCLAKEPSLRPPSAVALRDALRAVPLRDQERWSDDVALSWWHTYRAFTTLDASTADASIVATSDTPPDASLRARSGSPSPPTPLIVATAEASIIVTAAPSTQSDDVPTSA